jgi:protein transport protein SEC61 subunit alpha
MAIVIALFEAFAYVFNGMYGNIEDIGAFKALMIIVQLVFASILVNLLDEVLSKGGYGLVGAISLFIATNVAEDVLWKSFSFMKEGDEYEGAFIGFFDYLLNKPNKFRAVKQAFLRERLPNLNNVIATVAVFMVVNFFQGF